MNARDGSKSRIAWASAQIGQRGDACALPPRSAQGAPCGPFHHHIASCRAKEEPVSGRPAQAGSPITQCRYRRQRAIAVAPMYAKRHSPRGKYIFDHSWHAVERAGAYYPKLRSPCPPPATGAVFSRPGLSKKNGLQPDPTGAVQLNRFNGLCRFHITFCTKSGAAAEQLGLLTPQKQQFHWTITGSLISTVSLDILSCASARTSQRKPKQAPAFGGEIGGVHRRYLRPEDWMPSGRFYRHRRAAMGSLSAASLLRHLAKTSSRHMALVLAKRER